MLLDREWESARRLWARAYLGLVLLLFVYFLPLLIGLWIPASWFFQNLGLGVKPWSWFRSWI